MNISDPIADYLTRIRNAVAAGHDTVEIPSSKLKREISRILQREGFIRDVTLMGDPPKQIIKITLKYGPDRESVITGLKRVSSPGLRQYVNSDNVPRVLGGLGIALLTTSRGIMTDREARKSRTGGEVLCQIW
ncbi:MAG: 30S ribosomal protein S8 [Verrucomicrobia bacterium]|nr:30S ribosomal protein S8 [Verrucomicrobiota bacterium]MCH8510503.1 30S ribosomal protein S8 [Kiritimatiellia bacterium]